MSALKIDFMGKRLMATFLSGRTAAGRAGITTLSGSQSGAGFHRRVAG
jgi:hypothetical protein